ncbi:MAG: glutamine--tRNA ligase, partial [Candidatus Aegiribacteria sp.]|nr:glutamine--tRNA ligase [Candidatus Aegiribacteria sp.]
HWVSAEHSLKAVVRLYDRLFTVENPLAEDDFKKTINPDSLTILTSCRLEPSVADLKVGVPLQFERIGYFCADQESMPDKLIFNRTISLRDTWKKIQRNTPVK